MRSEPPAPRVLRALAAAALLAAGPALGQTSPWTVGLAQTVSHDDNLLRLANGQPAPEGFARSDTVSSTALLAGLDQPFGRQRFTANLALRDNRFDRNSLYDNRSHTLAAGLDWSTVERVSGALSASVNRGLSGLNATEVGLLREKNLERTGAAGAVLRVGLETEWSAEASIGARRVDNSLELRALQSREFRQDSGAVGLRWRPRAGSSFGLALRQARGRYPKYLELADGSFQADRFSSDDVDLTASVVPSGASRIELRLSSGRTRYDLNEQRNFDGFTGNLAWNWAATGKTRFVFSFTRDRGQDSYATTAFNTPGSADYSRVTSALRARVDHDPGAKITTYLTLTYLEREIVRTVTLGPFALPPASGRERSGVAALGLRWLPTRAVALGCEAGHEDRRGSGDLGSGMRTSNIACFGQVTLQ
jgi:hypothetical protein